MANHQTKEWLKAAYADLRSMFYIINDDFLTHIVAFHSQQAIEKTLKAIIIDNEERIPRVHKLQNLINRVELDFTFNDETIEILDELYIDSRYPTDVGLLPYGKPTLEDAKKFYAVAEDFFNKSCNSLGINENEINS